MNLTELGAVCEISLPIDQSDWFIIITNLI